VRYSKRREPLAQLVEHLTFNQGVLGSIPRRLTIHDAQLHCITLTEATDHRPRLSENCPSSTRHARAAVSGTTVGVVGWAATYSARREIKRNEVRQKAQEGLGGLVEAIVMFAAFDVPCAYGADYGRPLRILGFLIPAFAVIYSAALTSTGKGGIWLRWARDRIHAQEASEAPARMTSRLIVPDAWIRGRGSAARFIRSVRYSLYFSVLSAFHIGWRELNIGSWISRMQPNEYTLQATGWVRVVSGAQSLLSVYLIALWALSYFGRPFE
jgi:hypothetical protein